jgi:arylsulfatase A-like enzyme
VSCATEVWRRTLFVLRGARALPAGCLVLAFLATACQRSRPRPSIVLAVLDTTRADAVSAYGEVQGTTPNVDALARDGLLYEHAYANANWTLPSHATIFTGLLPMENGVRGGADKLESVPTLAELLGKAGYETVGINENPWLTRENGLARGFQRWKGKGWRMPRRRMVKQVEKWLAGRRKNRPFFLFLNIMDAHRPYRIRKGNPYLPGSFDLKRAKRIMKAMNDYICRCTPDDPDVLVLRALYYDSVRAADAKLGAVLDAVRAVAPSAIVVAASDHGEQFGEHGLLEHDMGVGHALLHVPLVVHGLPDVAPARISTPVQLADLTPAILAWAGVAAPPGLAGQPLPTAEPAPRRQRAILSEHHDEFASIVESTDVPDAIRRKVLEEHEQRWLHCADSDRISGDMLSLIRYPYKYDWYEEYPPQLFDVRVDPGEERDLSAAEPEMLSDLGAAFRQVLASAARPRQSCRAHLDSAQVERLRAFGYLGGEAVEGTEQPRRRRTRRHTPAHRARPAGAGEPVALQ